MFALYMTLKTLASLVLLKLLKSLPKFFKLRTYLKRVMMKEKPDILVCVDYPGFNMKLAAVANELGDSRFFIILRLRFGPGTAVVAIRFASM